MVFDMKNYLSIDIGGTNIKFARLDNSGKIIEQDKVATPNDKDSFLQTIDQIIAKYISEIKGIAFCAPGKVEKTKIRFGGSLPFLDGIDFAEIYGKKYHIPVGVINDGKASVLAENWLGSLKDEDNCAAITLGTAVGGGIIVDGHLLRGVHYQAGELSFMIADSLHAKDMAGNVGTLDSAVGLVESINKVTKHDDFKDGRHAFEMIKQNVPEARESFTFYCRQIAILILNIQSVIDIRKFAIGGGISAQSILISGINDAYDELTNRLNPMIGQTLHKPDIVASEFRNDSNLYGALYNLLLQINHENEY